MNIEPFRRHVSIPGTLNENVRLTLILLLEVASLAGIPFTAAIAAILNQLEERVTTVFATTAQGRLLRSAVAICTPIIEGFANHILPSLGNGDGHRLIDLVERLFEIDHLVNKWCAKTFIKKMWSSRKYERMFSAHAERINQGHELLLYFARQQQQGNRHR